MRMRDTSHLGQDRRLGASTVDFPCFSSAMALSPGAVVNRIVVTPVVVVVVFSLIECCSSVDF